MNKEKDLFSVMADIEGTGTLLEELGLLIEILDGEIEEGLQFDGKQEVWREIHYAQRVPRRLALIRVIQRELSLRIKELDESCSQLLEMHKAQKEVTT